MFVVAVSESALALGALEATKVPVIAVSFSDLAGQRLLAGHARCDTFLLFVLTLELFAFSGLFLRTI